MRGVNQSIVYSYGEIQPDPDPLVAGPDAHGTNAEWYNAVCSNVFSAVEESNGIVLAPRTGEVNTNAYYFVDVIADRGPAPIHFVADGESRLGNPVLIAQAGETNRVPLLIGATYSVTSDVPLRVFAPAAAVVEAQAAAGRFRIGWPVSLGYSTADGMTTPTVSEAERLHVQMESVKWRM